MADQTNQTANSANFYALLIGIDCYIPNRLSNGDKIKSLSGCVRNISHVEAFLKEMWKIPENHIMKLTASVNGPGSTQPSEPPEQFQQVNVWVVAFPLIY